MGTHQLNLSCINITLNEQAAHRWIVRDFSSRQRLLSGPRKTSSLLVRITTRINWIICSILILW